MDHLTLSLFGPFQMSVNQQEVLGLNTVRGSLLLAYLALEDGKPHSRKDLSKLFWPESSLRAAQNSLRQTLYRIKSTIQPKGHFDQFFKADRSVVQFEKTSSHWIDVKTFQQLSNQRKHGNFEREEKLALSERIAQLFRGDFLEGVTIDDASDLDNWLHSRRAWFHHQAIDNLQKLSADYIQLGKLDLAQIHINRLLEIDPINERGFEKKVEILLEKGQTVEAKAQFEQFKQKHIQQIGIEPNPAIKALLKNIPPPKPRAALPTQLQPAAPVKPKVPIPKVKFTLPSLPTPYFHYLKSDSEQSLGLKNFLSQSAGKTLLIQGIPGSGKSALMIELGHELAKTSSVFYIDFKLHTAASLTGFVSSLAEFTQGKPVVFLLDHLDRVPQLSKVLEKVSEQHEQTTIIGASRLPLNVNLPKMTKIYHTGVDTASSMQILRSNHSTYDELQDQTLLEISSSIGGHPSSLHELLRWNQIFPWPLILQKIKLNEFLWEETPLADWFDTIWQSLSEAELAFMSRFSQFNNAIYPEELANAPLSLARAALVSVERGLFQKSADGNLKCHPLFKLWIRSQTLLFEPEISQLSIQEKNKNGLLQNQSKKINSTSSRVKVLSNPSVEPEISS
ncbi:MAG: BTAD domain-containing putative transcriptional regulator [Chloroflexota bacterium]